jgi:ribosomal protein S18 acetylase RimI-like enzyme
MPAYRRNALERRRPGGYKRMMSVAVRPATADDAEATALAHVRSWQAAYAGIVPDDILAGLDPAAMADRHRGWLPRTDGGRAALVVERDGAVVGFAAIGHYRGPEHDSEPDPTAGEVFAIYVHPTHWRAGAGRALMEAAVAKLTADRPRPVRLWVFDANESARLFYQRCGFAADGAAGRFPITGAGGTSVDLPIVRYTRPATG